MTRVVDVENFGRYWVAIIVFGDDELGKYLEAGRKQYQDIIDIYCEGDRGNCGEDVYIGYPEDYAAAIVISNTLNEYCEKHECPIPFFDLSVSEEPGYSLPEFSVYYNPDARSWSGRWAWSGSGMGVDLSESGLFWALVAEEDVQDEIAKWLEEVIEKEGLKWHTDPGRDEKHWAVVIVRG